MMLLGALLIGYCVQARLSAERASKVKLSVKLCIPAAACFRRYDRLGGESRKKLPESENWMRFRSLYRNANCT